MLFGQNKASDAGGEGGGEGEGEVQAVKEITITTGVENRIDLAGAVEYYEEESVALLSHFQRNFENLRVIDGSKSG